MTGWRVLPWHQQKAIGIAVHTARLASPPAPWKELARKFGRSPRQLERYEQAAIGAGIADLFEPAPAAVMTPRFIRIPFEDRHAEKHDTRGCIIKDCRDGRTFSVLGDVEQQAAVCNALNIADEQTIYTERKRASAKRR